MSAPLLVLPPLLPLLHPDRQIGSSGADCYRIIVSHFKCLTQLRCACHFLPEPFTPCSDSEIHPVSLLSIFLSVPGISVGKERSPLLLLFIILITTPPFTSQTSPPLAEPQKGKVRGDNERGNRSPITQPPPFPRLDCIHSCMGKTKPSGEEAEKARGRTVLFSG